MATKNIIKEIPTDFDKDLVLTPSAPVPSDIGSGLPAVLEDLAKRELDRPMTRRELFRRGKRAVQIGGGAALDRSKIGDWIIGDDTISSEMEGLIEDLLGVNEDVYKKMDEIYKILPIATIEDMKKISKEMHEDLSQGLDYMETELWSNPYPEEDGFSIAHGVEETIEDILLGELQGPITQEARDKLNKVLPLATSLRETVDKRADVFFDLYDQIRQDYPEIYDIEPYIYYDEDSRAANILSPILDWVSNKTWIGEDKKRLKNLIEQEKKIGKEWIPEISDVIKKADKDYPAKIEQSKRYAVKKKEDEAKRRRLIESATDLARRLAAPPTGTVPGGKQVKPPVQETKPPVQQPQPAQPKIPAPRATMEQPSEQGRGLSNIARMLPAVGKRLPFVAPAAALLRSRPAGVDADIVPPDPLGTGRVYRNYHDYNPRNI